MRVLWCSWCILLLLPEGVAGEGGGRSGDRGSLFGGEAGCILCVCLGRGCVGCVRKRGGCLAYVWNMISETALVRRKEEMYFIQ